MTSRHQLEKSQQKLTFAIIQAYLYSVEVK